MNSPNHDWALPFTIGVGVGVLIFVAFTWGMFG